MPKKNYNKSAKLQHSSLLRKNTVKFGRDFTRARKQFTQALLARSYVFPSLLMMAEYSLAAEQNIPFYWVGEVMKLDFGFSSIQSDTYLAKVSFPYFGSKYSHWDGAAKCVTLLCSTFESRYSMFLTIWRLVEDLLYGCGTSWELSWEHIHH